MTITLAHDLGPSRITIAYESLGDPADPAVLLIHGGGAQLGAWPDELCAGLVARGLRVVRFDNRDVGQSTHMTGAPPPDFAAALAGDLACASYTLADMVADTVALLDHLAIARAHVVGCSLGGYIAQLLAADHPARVCSLVSLSSTTGDRAVGQPHPDTFTKIGSRPPPRDREEAAEQMVAAFRVIGSPAYPLDEERIRERARIAFDRDPDPTGMFRQAIATIATGDRTPRLRTIAAPTLVLHGEADPMTDISGGRATAAAIPNARLVTFPGMGHDFPRPLWPRLVDEIAAHVAGAPCPPTLT